MAKAIWTGFISFGLISIPVELVSALKEKEVTFRKLDSRPANPVPVQQKLVNPEAARKTEIPRTKIEKGVAVAPNQHVVVKKEELAAIKPKAQKELEIATFVEMDAVDPIFYDKPYYLLPRPQGEKAYALMVKAMTETKKAAVSTLFMRGKEYLSLLRPVDGRILSLQTLRFPEEVQPIGELAYKPVVVEDKALDSAMKLINALTEDFNPGNYYSQYQARLRDLINEKVAAHEIVTETTPDDSLLGPGPSEMAAKSV